MPTITETTFRDIPALRLEDDSLRLTVIPGWGGKIPEIYDLRRGREWLSENPALPYRLPHYGASYVRDFDVGGFDECFPTVGICRHPSPPWEGTPLPDHGEVWSLPWAARVEGDALCLSTHGVRLPYRLEKRIALHDGGRIRFEYIAVNPTPFPMPFLWSSHPLFALRPGIELDVPVDRVRVFSTPSFPARHGDVIPWPRFEGMELNRAPAPHDSHMGIATKLFSAPLSEGWAVLRDPADGAAFRFDFDPTAVTHLGLWLNYGGWAGAVDAAPYFNIAIEPCIGAPDDLDVAVNHWHEHGLLPPGGSSGWWLQMTVT